MIFFEFVFYGVKSLLENNAKTDIKNKKGQTAYDLAVKSGNRGTISCFTSSLGSSMIGSKKQKTFIRSKSRERDQLDYDNDFDF